MQPIGRFSRSLKPETAAFDKVAIGFCQVTCAIREVAGPEAFPNFQRVIRHGDWTDGTAGVSTYTLPTVGRKNDVWRDTKSIRQMVKRYWDARSA